MQHYKVEILVKSDRAEDNLALFMEGLVMRGLEVEDLAVYPVPPTVTSCRRGQRIFD